MLAYGILPKETVPMNSREFTRFNTVKGTSDFGIGNVNEFQLLTDAVKAKG